MITVSVQPNGGGDYTSLNAALAALVQDLVANNENITINCSNGVDITQVAAISNAWVCDATHKIYINGSITYKLVAATSSIVAGTNGTQTTRADFKNLWFESQSTSGTLTVVSLNIPYGYFIFDSCIFKRPGNANYANSCLDLPDTSGKIVNCLFTESNSLNVGGTSSQINFSGSGKTLYLYNNTIFGNFRSITASSGTIVAKNNIFAPWGTSIGVATFSDSNYNATNLGLCTGGANDVINFPFIFDEAEIGNGNIPWNIQNRSQLLGTDLRTDPDLPVTTDINGNTRPATPMCGCYETPTSQAEPTDRIIRIGPARIYTTLQDAVMREPDFQPGERNLIFEIDDGEYNYPTIGISFQLKAFNVSEKHRIIVRAANGTSHNFTRGQGVRLINNGFYADDYTHILNVAISGKGNQGIYLSDYCVVENCFIFDTDSSGYNSIYSNNYFNIIKNCILVGNYTGIYFFNGGGYILNTFILNSISYGFRGANFNKTVIINSYIGGSGISGIDLMTPLINSFTDDGSYGSPQMSLVDAGFISTTAGAENLRLLSTSKLRAAGKDLRGEPFNIATDGRGAPRPEKPCVGAIEYTEPTDRIVTIGPDKDYTSLASAIAGEEDFKEWEKDIVFKIDAGIYAESSTLSSAFTTSVNHKIIIKCADNGFHNFQRNTGVRITALDWNFGFQSNIAYVNFFGIAFNGNNNNSTYSGLYCQSSVSNIIAKNCFFYDWVRSGTCSCFFASPDSKIINCAFVNNAQAAQISGDAQNYVYNSIFINNVIGLSTPYVNAYIKNCYFGANGVNIDNANVYTLNLTSVYTSDGSLSTPILSLASCGFANTVTGSEDIHISQTSGLIGLGTDLSADSVYPVKTDALSVTRRTTPCLGPLEVYPVGEINEDIQYSAEHMLYKDLPEFNLVKTLRRRAVINGGLIL